MGVCGHSKVHYKDVPSSWGDRAKLRGQAHMPGGGRGGGRGEGGGGGASRKQLGGQLDDTNDTVSRGQLKHTCVCERVLKNKCGLKKKT